MKLDHTKKLTCNVEHGTCRALSERVGRTAHIVALISEHNALDSERRDTRRHVKCDLHAGCGQDLFAVVVPLHLGRWLALNLACELQKNNGFI